ncbi:Protein CMS1 [Vanrija pseudolonga]|uniref:Protein CMS1 n=1 Tax=Vanrija pseudolonga TaxID=143232 RepID=A0AAF0YBY3_9TREE|nr:Protein CMS1 [Vanrija pseudolonga]
MTPAYKTGGDDLDDGLELDPDLLASDDEDVGDIFSADEDDAPAPVSRKRKASGDVSAAAVADAEGDVAMLPVEGDAKKRRREKDKARRAAKRAAAAGDDGPIADPSSLEPAQLAQLLLSSARATFPNSTPMEIDEVVVGEDRLLAPLPPTSTGSGFEPLVQRLDDLLKDAPKKPAPGTPRALIVSLSGIRCADVVRAVRDVKRPGGEVAKLFAKHFKLVDQVKYLAKTRVAIAVGTPARVAKLLADGALKVKQETVVLFDIGHRDSKNRTLLSLPEARDELWKSLLSGEARAALTRARVKYTAF